jgi:hypothetical protein
MCIVAPALDGVIYKQSASVESASYHNRGTNTEVDGRKIVSHVAVLIAADHGVTETELPIGICSPALD